jgi:predicted RNA binding protein YcfA (HicA-like mRNA interferase family)
VVASGRLPVVSGKRTIKALQRAGYELRRTRGSHHVMLHPGPPQRIVSVPVHGNHPLPPGTLSAILDQTNLSVEEFMSLL